MTKRVVVKVGSNVLTRKDGKLDITRVSSLVDQIATLRTKGLEIILVSSGAMACARSEVTPEGKLDLVGQRQLFSAVGQVRLINLYYDLFREYGIHIAQVLTMKESFSTRNEYLNQRSCMSVMLENGVLPIVNENDTVSVTELMFTDNDELSGLIASMMDASMLVILSNIDGIYNGSPGSPDARIIPVVEYNQDISECIGTQKSGFGRGGMTSKYGVAKKVSSEGIKVVIANGKRDNILVDLLDDASRVPHTEFKPSDVPTSTMKKWIAHSESFSKGVVTVNDDAVRALCGDRAVSLLLVGVVSIEGDFEENDIVNICDGRGRHIAVGRVAYSSEDARRLIGKHDVKPLVHYDYMFIDINR